MDKEEGEIPQPFKGAKPKQTRGRGKPKGKPQEQRQNPPKAQEADETYTYENPNNYYHNALSQSQGHRPYNGQGGNRQFRGFMQRNRGQRPQYSQHQFQNYCYQRSTSQQNCTQYGNGRKPYFQGNHGNMHIEAEAVATDLSNSEVTVMVGPNIRITMECISISITHMTHNQNNMVLPAVYVVDSTIPPSTATRVNMT